MMNKESKYINVKGQLMDLSEPRVMGILNVTPDSFYSESRLGQWKRLLHVWWK